MIKILIVEDEKPISDLIKMSLSGEGYCCVCAFDGAQAADIIEKESFDLILLDIMLPKIDGYELMEYIKIFGIPVIFITARSDVLDRVKGLRAGAEDYITKPFEIIELSARIETVLRRYSKTATEFSIGDIAVNIDSRRVTRNGTDICLTAKEFDLLLFLWRNKNRALYRAQIYSQVWGNDYLGESRTVDLHIQRLRKKLSLEKSIIPVYKIGYRLEVKD